MPEDQVFISYSHKDKRWHDDLDTHLRPYLRGGSIVSWSDEQIAPGSEWFKEIQSALANSKVAVLLVSPDFLASDFIHEHELGPLLKEAEQGGVKILWVPVRESAYKQTPLKKYQAVFDPGKPLAGMTKAKRDQAWVKICEEIEKAVNPSLGSALEGTHGEDLKAPGGKLRLTVHRAYFLATGTECFFVNATNILSEGDLEITHVWFATNPEVYVINPDRLLPRRLKPQETWETYVRVAVIPPAALDQVYTFARARLSTGEIIQSSKNIDVPNYGTVPGGSLRPI